MSARGPGSRGELDGVLELTLDRRSRLALEALAATLDWRCACIDLADGPAKDALLERLAAALHFPDWFGGNWDALYDCLTDLGWWPARGYLLVLEHASALRASDPTGLQRLVDLLADVAEAWRSRGIPFRTVVDVH